jgi:F-type H+-transporting ATPase subunit b
MRLSRDFGVWMAIGLPCMLLSLPAMAEESDKGGLPQLDTTLFPEQLFWLALSFGLLYLLMSRLALPRVAQTQKNRRQVIAADLAAAQQANDAAHAAAAQVDKALADARGQAQVTVSTLIAEVTADAAEKQAAQEKALQRRLHTAEEEIAVARTAAIQSVSTSVSDLAAMVVEKVLGVRGRVES